MRHAISTCRSWRRVTISARIIDDHLSRPGTVDLQNLSKFFSGLLKRRRISHRYAPL